MPRSSYVRLLLLLVAVGAVAAASAAPTELGIITTQVVTVQNCTCAGCPPKLPVSGTCGPDPFNAQHTRTITCLSQTQMCASIANFNDNACLTPPAGGFNTVCGACFKQSFKNGVTYSIATCDNVTQQVAWNTDCNNACDNCLNQQILPFSECANGYLNQGIAPCDAVNVVVFNSPTCGSGALVDNYTTGQFACSNGEYMSCSPSAPPPLPPRGLDMQIVVSQCPWGTPGCQCDSFAFPNAQCSPTPPWNTMAKSHEGHCDKVESTCANLVISNNTVCSDVLGKNTPVCGSCITSFNSNGTYVSFQCDATTQTVTVLTGCQVGCKVCTGPTVNHPYLACSASMYPGASVYNRGLFPCSTVTFSEYQTSKCTNLVHTFQVAQAQCTLEGQTLCTPRTVTWEQCFGCEANNQCATQVSGDDACVLDVFGYYRKYHCNNNADNCVTALIFSGANCERFQGVYSAMCNTCIKFSLTATTFDYQYVACNLQTQAVTVSTNCTRGCGSCAGSAVAQFPYNKCTDAPASVGGGTFFNQGISSCDAVFVEIFNQTSAPAASGCAAAVLDSYWVGQHQCSFNEYITCSGDPMPIAPPAQELVGSFCVPFEGCRNCVDLKWQVNECVGNIFGRPGYHQFQCDPVESWCADLTLFGGSECNGFFLGQYHPVCGSCFPEFFNQKDFVYWECDQVHQNFTVSFGCDSSCQNCKNPNAITHGFLQCSNLLVPNITFFNRGVIPCQTVSFVEFPDNTCNDNTATAWYQLPVGTCEVATKFQCAAETITVQNCTCESCNASVVAESTCNPDPYGFYRKLKCLDQVDQCATLLMFADTTGCTTFASASTYVCNVCTRSNPDTYGIYMCDPVTQGVTYKRGCNADCSVCSATTYLHPQNQCSASNDAGINVFNQGIGPCDAVTISVFNTSTCQATPVAVYTVGQHTCDYNELFACSAHPIEKPFFGGEIIYDQCPPGTQNCVGCNQTIVQEGGCVADPSGGSQFLFCLPLPLLCATIALNSNAHCSAYIGLHTPVCGECTIFPGDQTFTRVNCGVDSQDIFIIRNCVDPACLFCDFENRVKQKYLQCSVTPENASMSIFNRGVAECNVLSRTHFASPSCDPGSFISVGLVAEGVCQFDHRFQCTPRSVTVENCTCATCAAVTVPEASCQLDPFGMYRQYRCFPNALCTTVARFSDASCTTFLQGLTMVCDTCMKSIGPNGEKIWFRVACDLPTQAVTLTMGCGPLCAICFGPTYVHPWNQCSPDLNGGSAYNTGISQCETLEIAIYNNSGCTGFSDDTFFVGTNDCGLLGEYFACSAPATFPFQPSGQVIMSHCDHHKPYCVDCTDRIFATQTCNVAPLRQERFTAQIATCNQQESTCVDFAISENELCTANIGLHRPVCDTCEKFRDEDATFMSVTCDPKSQNVTITRGCQAGCASAQCTGPVEQHGFLQCTGIPSFRNGSTFSLFNRGLTPCFTVSSQRFSTANCAYGTEIASKTFAEGVCEFDHRAQCTPNTITIQNCSCPTCQPQVTGGFCTLDQFGFFRKYKCLNSAQNCASLISYSDNGCKDYNTVVSAVCGTCIKNGVLEPTYSLVSCNLNTQTVTLSTGCDSSCLSCSNPDSEVHAFDACSPDTQFGQSIFNQGIGPCDAVDIEVHFDPLCLSPIVERYTVGQHACMFDEFIECSANPAALVPAENTFVWYNCPASSFYCQGCAPVTAPAGQCTADVVSASAAAMVATCDTETRECAYLVVNTDAQCQSFQGIHAPVCGSCLAFNPANGGAPQYFFLRCSRTTQDVTLSTGCNADCSTCASTNDVVHPYLACSKAYFNSSVTLFNRGLYSCATATVQHFSSGLCGADSLVRTEVLARDTCNVMGLSSSSRVECVNSSAPAPAPPGPQGAAPSSGTATGVGIAVGAVGAAAIAAFMVFKLKGLRGPSRFVPEESAMNEASAPAVSRSAGSYGALQ